MDNVNSPTRRLLFAAIRQAVSADMVVEYLFTQFIPSRARRVRRWALWGVSRSVVKSAREGL